MEDSVGQLPSRTAPLWDMTLFWTRHFADRRRCYIYIPTLRRKRSELQNRIDIWDSFRSVFGFQTWHGKAITGLKPRRVVTPFERWNRDETADLRKATSGDGVVVRLSRHWCLCKKFVDLCEGIGQIDDGFRALGGWVADGPFGMYLLLPKIESCARFMLSNLTTRAETA
jgi:hypothetical protein